MIMNTLVGKCLKCGFTRDVPTSLKTRIFICPECGKQGPLTYNNIVVVWLKTLLVNAFWGAVLIGAAVAGVYYYPRVVGHYEGEGPEAEVVAPESPTEKGQP